MEFALRDGDYQPDGRGSFAMVQEPEAILQRALIRLSARRGCLPWLPELGSRLHTLCRMHRDDRESAAAAYVSEALAPEPEVRVDTVSVRESEPGRLSVEITLDAQGRQAIVEVTL